MHNRKQYQQHWDYLHLRFCSTPTINTDQLQPPAISSSLADARAKISSSRSACARSKRRLRRMQQHANKNYDDHGRLTIARQHKRGTSLDWQEL